MSKFLKGLEIFLKIFVVISIVGLSAILYSLFGRLNKIESYLAGLSREVTSDGKTETLIQKVDICGEDCQRQIDEIVAKAVSTISATTITKTEVQRINITPAPGKNTAYIPLVGPITTTSQGWVDAAGTDVYIDLVNDYGKNTWVSWEAFLKIADGNGQAFARLYDATHNIAVNGSEVSVTSGTSTQVISGELKFWAGRNLYRVQIKSLNSFVATFVSGRIKINY